MKNGDEKTGIEITCENCAASCHYRGTNNCPRKTSIFTPTRKAYEARIRDLQKQITAQSFAALIRRFQWAEYDTYAEAKCGDYLFKVEKMDRFESWIWSAFITPTKYIYDSCKGLKEGEQAAQNWLVSQFFATCKFPFASGEHVLVLSLEELDLLKRGINEIFGYSSECLDNFKAEKKARITRILAKINSAIESEERK